MPSVVSVHQPEGLASIIKRFYLKMPPHQREYSWTDKEVGRYYNDLRDAIDGVDGDSDQYFLGCIVTIPHYKNQVLDYIEIIDGQQRLATTSIFIIAARDYLNAIDENDAATRLNNDYIESYDYSTDNASPKLVLNQMDNQFFNNYLIKGDHNFTAEYPSHTKIINSYKKSMAHIKSQLTDIPIDRHRIYLHKWISFLAERACVVRFEANSKSDAYKMFETLNDRGLSTTQADLIKNHIFGRCKDSGLSESQTMWSSMRSILKVIENKAMMNKADDIIILFLWHALVCKQGKSVKKENIYEKTEAEVKSSEGAFRFLSFLKDASNNYVAIFNPDHSKWSKYPHQVKDCIKSLNTLDVSPMQPLLLSIALRFEKNELLKSFKFLISLAVRLFIATSTRSGAIYDYMGAAAKEVNDGGIVSCEELKVQLSKITPDDNYFEEKFAVATVSNAKLARYYLRTIERSILNMPDPELVPNQDPSQLTLEHILPKSPSEDDYGDFSEGDAKMYLKRIGNLALLSAKNNSDLKNLSFEEKRKILTESNLETTRMIEKYSSWSVDAIKSRQLELTKYVVKAWPI